MDEIRAVTAFAVTSAEQVLPLFEASHPDDSRPRDALAAAAAFVRGDRRSRAQRVTATAAHRAGREAAGPVPFHAAMAAGDAAASAYLHPLADAAQVNHILRASAHAIRVFELRSGDEHDGDPVECVVGLATPLLIDVLRRYPRIGAGTNRVSRLVHELDNRLRDQPCTPPMRQSEGR
ncbi:MULTISPECIES: putative immunity protein [Nocardia]|uniref:Exonuclease SbcC n=1 Tax=Nocardia implantans TaxID=3108168 RepID=A0ABU6B4L4_9NOCA|nr:MULTISPECIES: exonuclease SbcC [unclassified Nocardia]MBF6196195.1 exonuclease SbcC [Nocardia beijingensis]MEA3532835.1 exonuclease SbcC [Nocardia sp. CDC192]MEB3514707.1 exonuclease SbcC [Nocardia sp. CDC186]